jgi:hypothetical protein
MTNVRLVYITVPSIECARQFSPPLKRRSEAIYGVTAVLESAWISNPLSVLRAAVPNIWLTYRLFSGAPEESCLKQNSLSSMFKRLGIYKAKILNLWLKHRVSRLFHIELTITPDQVLGNYTQWIHETLS